MEARQAEWNGMAMSYLWRAGTVGGPGLVLLHGLCGGAVHFDRVFADTNLERCSIAAVDLPGFGDSAAVACSSLEDMAAAVAATMEQAGLNRPWMAAHSMSASVAVRLLDRIAGLSLIEGNLVPAHLQFSDKIVGQDMESFAYEYRRMQDMAEFILKYETRVMDASDRRRYAATYRACSAKSVWQAAKYSNAEVRSGGIGARLAQWNGPLSCIYGSRGDFGATLEVLPHDLRLVATHRVEDAGHFPMLDRPDETYAAIAEDIARNLDPHIAASATDA